MFPVSRGDLSLLSVWKSALELFVHNKSMINSKHEFAIVILKDSAQWVRCGGGKRVGKVSAATEGKRLKFAKG